MQHNSRPQRQYVKQTFNKPSFNPSKKEYNVVENLQDYMFTGTNLTRYAKDMFTISKNNNNSNHSSINSNHTKNKNSYLEPGKDKYNNTSKINNPNIYKI